MCVKTLTKLVIGVLTTVFALIGVAIFIAGLALRFSFSKTVTDYIKEYVKGIQSADKIEDDINKYIEFLPDVMNSPNQVFFAIIVFGFVMALVGIIGLLAICSENKTLLIIYIAILAFCIGCEAAICMRYYWKKGDMATNVKKTLQETIDTKYSGYNVKNVETMLWNVVHLGLECCGINGGGDFKNASLWVKNVTIKGNIIPDIANPVSCCKIDKFQECLGTKVGDPSFTNAQTGCWDKATVYLNSTENYTLTIGYIVAGLQIFILAFSYMLYTGGSE